MNSVNFIVINPTPNAEGYIEVLPQWAGRYDYSDEVNQILAQAVAAAGASRDPAIKWSDNRAPELGRGLTYHSFGLAWPDKRAEESMTFICLIMQSQKTLLIKPDLPQNEIQRLFPGTEISLNQYKVSDQAEATPERTYSRPTCKM